MLCYSRVTPEQQNIFNGDRQNRVRSNVKVDSKGIGSFAYKRTKDKSKDGDDSQPPSKKPHRSVREDLEHTASTVLHGRCALHQASSTCCIVTDSQSFDSLQTGPHIIIHRPFQTASSVFCSNTNTNTGRPPSPAVSGCQLDDDRRDVTSWADCLRQLAVSLRRRQDANVSGQTPVGPVAVLTPAVVGSLDQETTVDDRCRPDGKQRDPGCDDDIIQQNQLQSVSDEDYRSVVSSSSINNNNNNSPVSKLDPSTTEHARSIDDLQRSLSVNAPAVQGPGLTHTHTYTVYTHARRYHSLYDRIILGK